jgi:hypothetical protein
MSLRTIVEEAVDLAFEQLEELLVSVVYHSGAAEKEVQAFVAPINWERAASNIEISFKKLKIKATEFEGFSPSRSDWFEIAGERAGVMIAEADPTQTLWTFYVAIGRNMSAFKLVETVTQLVALSMAETPDVAMIIDRDSPFPFYRYNRAATDAADGVNILEPAHGVGRYFGRTSV